MKKIMLLVFLFSSASAMASSYLHIDGGNESYEIRVVELNSFGNSIKIVANDDKKYCFVKTDLIKEIGLSVMEFIDLTMRKSVTVNCFMTKNSQQASSISISIY